MSKAKLFWIFRRVPILYVIGFLIFHSMVNYQDVTDRARVASLNRLMPIPQAMVDFILRDQVPSDGRLREYLMYYQGFNEIAPDRPDVHAMMAFCYYYLGNTNKAIHYYEKAIIGNPVFIWFYYDLAVIYFQKGDYKKAMEYAQHAIDVEREPMVSFLRISKPYSDVAHGFEDQSIIDRNFQMGRGQSFQILILSHFNRKEYSEVLHISKIALRLAPEYRDFFTFYSALAAFELKQYQIALSYIYECMKVNDKYSDAYYYLGLTQKILGNESLATQAMRTYALLKASKAPERPQIKDIKVRIF